MLVIVSASMWMPLASRSPRAASETACWNRSRSVMSSSMVSVPAMDRSDPSSTFFTIVSIWLSGSPMNRSAAARRRSGSRAILNIAWPVMSTPTPCLLTAAFSLVRPISTWRAVSCRRPTLLMSGQTNVPPPTTTLTPLSSSVVTVPAASRNLLPCAPEMMSASFAPATRYLRAARSASMTMTAMVAKISCVIVIDTLIPSFHSRDAPAVLRRRHLSNGDAHPVDRDDLDVTASGDRGRRDGGQDLHRAVVGETDRAARPRPDAHGDASGPSDKVLESGRLGRLGPAEAAKDQERERETGQPERRRRAELSDGPRWKATRPNRPPRPNIARKPSSSGVTDGSSTCTTRTNGNGRYGIRIGTCTRSRAPPPRMERKRSIAPSSAEPVKRSSNASFATIADRQLSWKAGRRYFQYQFTALGKAAVPLAVAQ